LREATAGDPQNLQFKLMLAQACLWSKQYQCVLDTYGEILTLDANSAEAHMLAGEAYDGERNEANALEEFKAAIDVDPKLPNVHFGYGYMLWRLLKFTEAEKEFTAELANDPEHPLALTYLGDTKIRLEHVEDAGAYLEHGIRVDPSIALSHLDLGTVYESRGRKEDALREFKTAASLAPGDQKIHWRLAQFYQSLGRKEEAKAEFQKTQTLQKSADESVLDKIRNAKPRPQGQQPETVPKE
jgi:tetratricopeptide (TPR) repeat protein